jgi:hypothetical protein
MLKRLCGVAFVVLLCLPAVAWPSAAVEGTGEATEQKEPPTYEELRQQSGERAQEFFPEPYTPPPFFRFFAYPLLIVGVVAVVVVLFLFLLWQPNFARERRSGRRR